MCTNPAVFTCPTPVPGTCMMSGFTCCASLTCDDAGGMCVVNTRECSNPSDASCPVGKPCRIDINFFICLYVFRAVLHPLVMTLVACV